MPSIKDITTVNAIAREYCKNGRCKGLALQAIGYADSYSINGGRGCEVVFSNVQVINAIKTIDDANEVKDKYNYSIAMRDLDLLISSLQTQAEQGNIQAKGLLLSTIKEKNDITGLHKQIIVDDTEKPSELTEEERILYKQAAERITKLRLHKELA